MIRHIFFHLRPKLGGMVHFFSVAQFVNYHIIKYLGRAKHQQTIEIQVTLGRTTSPFAFLVSDSDATITDADQSGIVAHPVRNHLQSAKARIPSSVNGEAG